MDPPDDNQREIRDAMEKLERRRKARDVQYQLQQIVEDKDIGEKDKEAPEIQNPRREETSQVRLITFQNQVQQIVEDKDKGEKDKEAPEIQDQRREETSHGRLITFGYPNEREPSWQSDCHPP